MFLDRKGTAEAKIRRGSKRTDCNIWAIKKKNRKTYHTVHAWKIQSCPVKEIQYTQTYPYCQPNISKRIKIPKIPSGKLRPHPKKAITQPTENEIKNPETSLSALLIDCLLFWYVNMMMQIDQNSLDLIAVSSRAIFLSFIYSEVLLNVATFLAFAS